eukprot:6275922-Prymnesium_polylepis.1
MSRYGSLRTATEHRGGRSAAVAVPVGVLSVTFRCWCATQEVVDGKSPLYVRELYPYTQQP